MSDKRAADIADWAETQADERKYFIDNVRRIASTIPKEFGIPSFRKVLACQALDPHENLSITVKCQAAGISRQTWYNVKADPRFGELSVKFTNQVKGGYAMPVFMAFLDNCLKGSAQKPYGDASAQAKYLAEVGVVKDSPGASVSVTVTVEQLEQRRTASQRQGFNRLGFKIPQPVGGDN